MTLMMMDDIRQSTSDDVPSIASQMTTSTDCLTVPATDSERIWMTFNTHRLADVTPLLPADFVRPAAVPCLASLFVECSEWPAYQSYRVNPSMLLLLLE